MCGNQLRKKNVRIKTMDPWIKFPNLEEKLQNKLAAEGFESAKIQNILGEVKKFSSTGQMVRVSKNRVVYSDEEI